MASAYSITSEEYYSSDFYQNLRFELMDTLEFDSAEAETFMEELLKTA